MEKLKMPDFQTDTEEVAWWFDNQDQIALEAFEEMGKQVLLLDPKDAEIGKAKAAARGMSYEAYMAQLLHRALQDEAA
jgi:predicted DNA binding CopG/RHH family protein